MPPNLLGLLTAVQQPGVYRATQYLSSHLVVKLTRRRYGGKLLARRQRQETFLLTIGQPNAKERVWVKTAQHAGEPFPVKRLHIQRIP